MCTNSSVKMHHKLFFQVPIDAKRCKRWMTIMKLADPICPKTVAFSCEDHYDGEAETREALASLELLMSEFFAPATGNARKREIEAVLEAFSNRRDAWRHCLLFLRESHNHYVLMFTFTTLENIINRQWIGLSDAEKVEIRVTLWKHLTERHHTMVYFLRNKLAALIVAVARFDWPHVYPDFFTNILELINRGGRSTLLGLILAHCASEELGTSREGCVAVPSARTLELQGLMLKGMPQLLHALSDILEKNAQKDRHCDPPPPPSPSAGVPCPSALPDLLASSPDAGAGAPNKELMMEIVMKCLLTLQHLFSWLPLSSHVPPSLVTTVFHWGSAATQAQCGEAALAGLGGVCELLYRRYAPPSSAATALRLHHCALRLLRHLTQSNMHQAPHQYLNKLAEFLRLFVSLHFKRLEAEPEFDAIEFLSYLFQYTFQVPTCPIFVNCLDIWLQFVDIMKPEDTCKYSDALIALVNGILNKIQFQHNKVQLQHLDNETLDDDGETEWQTFLKHCIECVARVADLAPLHVFTLVLERWQCLAGVHARAAGRAGPAGEGERLLAALLDLATLTRTLGRLVPALLNEEKYEKRAESVAAAATLLERAAGTLAGAALTRPHHAPHAPPAIAHAHTHVHAEMFACMGACACYAATCGVPVHVMEGLYASAVPFLMPHDIPEPAVVCHAAAHLLLSLSKNLKLQSDPTALVGDLFAQAQRSLRHLEPKTAGVVREALVALALALSASPAGAAAAEAGAGAASRGEAAVRALVAAWAAPLVDGGGPAAARVALPPLSQLLYAFTDAPTHAKKVLAGAMQRPATVSLQLLCDQPRPHRELADFFLALFTCLLQQLGDFAHAAIDVFLEVAKREGGGEGGEGLERLLTCVRLGVETGGAGGCGGGARLAAVLRLLTRHALPHAAHPDAPPDLQRALYKLLASILLHRWRYFFSSNSDMSEDTERMEEFRTMLTAIGRSLLQPDIDVYRLNMETLEQLNTKWKLYHRAIFRSEFLGSFLSVLLLVLAERRQALLREETLAALYAMCAVDFGAFHRAFLPRFLEELPGLSPHQAAQLARQAPADTDLPTFTQNIQSLTNDIYYYRMCNSFLAPAAADAPV